MPRKPRFVLPDYPQHVILRGNDRRACFFAPSDYRLFLSYLAEAGKRHCLETHAYALMTNHVHLLVTPRAEFAISHAMQRLGQRYVQSINKQYRRTGTMWEGRFKSSLVQSDRYLLTCMRYIELNPVRAGMVEHPGDYPWSSYRANGLGHIDELLAQHPLYQALGATPSLRQHAYRQLFASHIDETILGLIRGTVNQELVLGSDRFRAQIEAMTLRQAGERRRGRPRKPMGGEEY
jgi:putative transposase